MKKLAIVLLLVATACRRQATTSPPSVSGTTGAATPREAVQAFIAAAKAQDLQAMSVVWGTSDGPAVATMERSSLEQREIILNCYLKHDSYQILSDSPATEGERMFDVEFKWRTLTRRTTFYVTRGPANRWYVRTFDLDALRDICATR